jgi:iron complex outermembrane receptor protein
MARFSFSSKKADGYFNVLDFECVNGAGSLGAGGIGIPNGMYNQPGTIPGGLPGIRLGSQVAAGGDCVTDTLGDENVQSGRAAFRFLINEQLEFNLIGDLTSQRQKGPADKYSVMQVVPNDLNSFWNFVFAEPLFGTGIGWDDRFLTDDMYSNYSRYNDPLTGRIVPNINDMEHWGVSGTFEWKLSDNMQLKSITGYRRFWNKFGRDSDGSPLPVDHTYDDSRHRQFTQEFQLTGTAGQLDWATGAFYYDAHDSNQGFGFLYSSIVSQLDAFDRQDTTNWAVFGQGTYRASDKLSLTAGVRYTDDQKDATIFRVSFFGDVRINNQFVPLSTTNTDFTLSANYQWNDDLMTYIKYATGFKGGGFSPRPANERQTDPFDPEKLKTLEVGAKSELLQNRIRLNGALFFSRYENQQTFAQQFDDNTPPENWFREINAGRSRIWGVEAELQAEPVDNFRIDGSLGYVNYTLVDNEGNELLFEGSDPRCGGGKCYSPRTPKFTGGLGLQYAFGSVMGGSITPRLDLVHQSKIYFSTNNQGVQDAYTLVNGRVAWDSADRDWQISIYGRNLTDEEYFNGKLSLIGFFGREQGNVGLPREYGITFQRNF